MESRGLSVLISGLRQVAKGVLVVYEQSRRFHVTWDGEMQKLPHQVIDVDAQTTWIDDGDDALQAPTKRARSKSLKRQCFLVKMT